jgi:hypothetical protein
MKLIQKLILRIILRIRISQTHSFLARGSDINIDKSDFFSEFYNPYLSARFAREFGVLGCSTGTSLD